MTELKLNPITSAADLLAAFAFYEICPGCEIYFIPCGALMQPVVVANNPLEKAVDYFNGPFRKEVVSNKFMGLDWITGSINRLNMNTLVSSMANAPEKVRCYITEQFFDVETQKEIIAISNKESKNQGDKNKLASFLKKCKTPLVFEVRGRTVSQYLEEMLQDRKKEEFVVSLAGALTPQDLLTSLELSDAEAKYRKVIKKKKDKTSFTGDLRCPKCGGKWSIENLDLNKWVCNENYGEDNQKCGFPLPLDPDQVLSEAMDKKYPSPKSEGAGDSLAYGLMHYLEPSSCQRQKQIHMGVITLRILMALVGLRIFPTYLCNDKVVVDGFKYRKWFIPLSWKPADKQTFLSLIRHPEVCRFQQNSRFWRNSGVGTVLVFQRQSKSVRNPVLELIN